MQSANNSPDQVEGRTNLSESDAIPDILKQFKLDFKLQRDGRKLDQYSHRWLFDSAGRLIGGEEQRQFNVDQLREFIQHKQSDDDGKWWSWRYSDKQLVERLVGQRLYLSERNDGGSIEDSSGDSAGGSTARD
jgi:hypothetical protein